LGVTTRGWCLLCVLLAPLAKAQTPVLVVQVLDAQGVSEISTRRAQRTAELLLKKISALAVGEGPVFKAGAPRRTCELACQRESAALAGFPAVALLTLKSTKAGATVEVSFWIEGERLGLESSEVSLESPDAGLKSALEAVLPAWTKRGWGAMRLETQPGAVVKLDGRPLTPKPGEVLSVPAGAHQLDVIYADGNAILQRVEVPEGSRTRFDLSQPPAAVLAAGESSSVLRGVSYGLWTAGAVAIAASLIAGTLSRQTGADQNPCTAESRSCSTIDVAAERHRQSEAYAHTGNILLGTGLGLASAGVGLFVIDLVRR
jgi:hypothetical protein